MPQDETLRTYVVMVGRDGLNALDDLLNHLDGLLAQGHNNQITLMGPLGRQLLQQKVDAVRQILDVPGLRVDYNTVVASATPCRLDGEPSPEYGTGERIE